MIGVERHLQEPNPKQPPTPASVHWPAICSDWRRLAATGGDQFFQTPGQTPRSKMWSVEETDSDVTGTSNDLAMVLAMLLAEQGSLTLENPSYLFQSSL